MSDDPNHTIPAARVRTKDQNKQRITATSTSAPTPLDQALQRQVIDDFTQQNQLLSDSAKTLLSLQIAIPTLFAALLKMQAGKDAILNLDTVSSSFFVIAAFLFWLLGLYLSLNALNPKRYYVDPHLLQTPADNKQQALDIYSFYQASTNHKHHCIFWSSFSAIAGLFCMLASLFL